VAFICGLLGTMLLIAGPVGRGGGHCVTVDLVPALAFTTDGSSVASFACRGARLAGTSQEVRVSTPRS